MTFLRNLFGLRRNTGETLPVPKEIPPTTSGEYITKISAGADLVDGKRAWQHAKTSKDDLEVMLKCCDAELKTMKVAKVVAAPFYFERAAILLRKAKRYDEEIEICQRYVRAVETHYSSVAEAYEADVRNGPGFRSIQARAINASLLRKRAR